MSTESYRVRPTGSRTRYRIRPTGSRSRYQGPVNRSRSLLALVVVGALGVGSCAGSDGGGQSGSDFVTTSPQADTMPATTAPPLLLTSSFTVTLDSGWRYLVDAPFEIGNFAKDVTQSPLGQAQIGLADDYRYTITDDNDGRAGPELIPANAVKALWNLRPSVNKDSFDGVSGLCDVPFRDDHVECSLLRSDSTNPIFNTWPEGAVDAVTNFVNGNPPDQITFEFGTPGGGFVCTVAIARSETDSFSVAETNDRCTAAVTGR